MRTFLVINTDNTYRTIQMAEKESGLNTLQESVGGYIEGVDFPIDNVRVYINEEGKIEGLPQNTVGTSLWTRSYPGVYDAIVGNMVVVGYEYDDEGYDTGLTQDQIDSFVARYGLVEV